MANLLRRQPLPEFIINRTYKRRECFWLPHFCSEKNVIMPCITVLYWLSDWCKYYSTQKCHKKTMKRSYDELVFRCHRAWKPISVMLTEVSYCGWKMHIPHRKMYFMRSNMHFLVSIRYLRERHILSMTRSSVIHSPSSDIDSIVRDAASLHIRLYSKSFIRMEGSLLRILRRLIRIKGIVLRILRRLIRVNGVGLRIKNLPHDWFLSPKCLTLCSQVTSSRINSIQVCTPSAPDTYRKVLQSRHLSNWCTCANTYIHHIPIDSPVNITYDVLMMF